MGVFFFDEDAARRIQYGVRRTEQIPSPDGPPDRRETIQQWPHHDYVTPTAGPVSGIHGGTVTPFYAGASGTGVGVFISRDDVPVLIRTPSLLPLPLNVPYWGRCEDYTSGVGAVSGFLPTYIVDDPYPTTSGGLSSGQPTFPQPTLVEPVTVTPASGVTSGGLTGLMSGNTFFTLIQSLSLTQLNLLNLTQIGGISLTATQTNNDVLITSVNGCPQYEWSCVSGTDTATQYDPTHSGKPLNQKTLNSGQVQDLYYDPVSGNPVVAIGAGGGFGVGGGIGGGAGGGGGFGGGGGGGAGGGILIFDPSPGLKSGTLAYGIVSSSGQATTTQYGQSGQVTNQKSTTTTYTSDTYYSPQTSGQLTLQFLSQSGSWGATYYYSGGNPANQKTVQNYGSGPTCIDSYPPPSGPATGGQTVLGFGRSGPFLTLGYPPPAGGGLPSQTQPNITLGWVPPVGPGPGTGNPYLGEVIDPGSPLTGPDGTAFSITDTSGNLVFGLDGSGLKSGSVQPWQAASGFSVNSDTWKSFTFNASDFTGGSGQTSGGKLLWAATPRGVLQGGYLRCTQGWSGSDNPSIVDFSVGFGANTNYLIPNNGFGVYPSGSVHQYAPVGGVDAAGNFLTDWDTGLNIYLFVSETGGTLNHLVAGQIKVYLKEAVLP